jgi:GR25 family glycosyltransferase involved in LPS biosynthesis
MKIQEFFDKAYYINLDSRPERRYLFEQEMKSAGLDDFFERVSAEDGTHEADDIRRHAYCSLTYMKLFHKIYEEGHERVLIFEDDAVFVNHPHVTGIEIVENALDQIDNFPDWDMLYFGGHPSTLKLVSPNLSETETILGTHAIGYTRKAIEKIFPYTPFVDSAIDGWLCNHTEIKKYLAYPLALAQREGGSDLDRYGKSLGPSHFLESYKRAEQKWTM